MLSKLRPRSIYDVMAAIACLVALGTGTAYAANTVRTGDIVDNEVFTTDVRDDTLGFGGLQHQDLGPGSVRGSEVLNNSLNGSDVAQSGLTGLDILDSSLASPDIADNSLNGGDIGNGSLNDVDVGGAVARDVAVNIGTIASNNCIYVGVENLSASGNHILLTPNEDDAHGALLYDARYDRVGNTVWIHVCNFSNAAVNDGITHFNLLTFDAH